MWNEIGWRHVCVIIREKVWLGNGLRHEDGGGGLEYRKKLWRVTTYIDANRRMCECDRVSRVGQGMVDVNYCVLGGCLLSLSLCRNGFHDSLRDRPSSLFMLCGCISSSMASLSYLSYLYNTTHYTWNVWLLFSILNKNCPFNFDLNLKVNHPLVLSRYKYVKKILFCTVTKHN